MLCVCGHVKENHVLQTNGRRTICAHACRCRRYREAAPVWVVLLLCLLMALCLGGSWILLYRSVKHGGF